MPLYTMRCEECNDENDVLVKTYKNKPKKCKKCGGKLVCKIGQVHVRFGAPGFAGNDYKIERELAENERIMAEPMEPGEMRAADDMLKEREKMLGLPEGRLTGKRKKTKLSKEAQEKAKGVPQPKPKKKSKEVKKLEKEWT